MAKKFLDRLKNTKSRTLLILIAIVILVIVLVVVFFGGSKKPLETEASRAAGIPNITSVPGMATPERYQELQVEANKRRAEEAKKTGTSAVATIIGTTEKDFNAKKETFGIEGKLGECKCPQTVSGVIPDLDPALANRLIDEIAADPSKALRLFQQYPGLARALCNKDPELAIKAIGNNKETAKIMLKECPSLAKLLAERNPELFKQLMLENPELAKKLAELYPDVFKKLMRDDPEFAKKMAQIYPDIVKNLMKNDPDFANDMFKQNPEMVKDLMKTDPDFAKAMAKNNPAMVKELMLKDPEFAKLMAQNNPEMVKELMANDPAFAQALAKSNPTLVKELMKNDPQFANLMGKMNPDMVKTLMKDDPEFARIMAKNNADMVDQLMKDDPQFAKELLEKNPGIDSILAANRSMQPRETDRDRIAALEAARLKQAEDEARASRDIQLTEAQQKQLADLMAGMEAQARADMQIWAEIAPQAYIQGEWAAKEEERKKAAGQGTVVAGGPAIGPGGPPGVGAPGVLVKAGTIFYSVLDTSVNTDEPGPILATIVEGPYKGGKLVGSLQQVTPPAGTRPEKVTLNFTTLSHPSLPTSISIQSVAVDPETDRTALATDVDKHYLLRYGTAFAAAFINGYSKVITSEGTVQTVAQNGLSSQTITPNLSGRKEVFAALGEVGKKWGDMMKPYNDAPNTITVDAGTGFGLLILTDVAGAGG